MDKQLQHEPRLQDSFGGLLPCATLKWVATHVVRGHRVACCCTRTSHAACGNTMWHSLVTERWLMSPHYTAVRCSSNLFIQSGNTKELQLQWQHRVALV